MDDFSKTAMEMLEKTGAVGNEMRRQFMDANIQNKLWNLGFDEKDSAMRVMGNIPLQVAFCRLKYRRDKHALPGIENIEAQAKYWKRVYNSELGRGTIEHFIKANKSG